MASEERLAVADRLAGGALALAALASVAGLVSGDVYRDRAVLFDLTRADDVFRLVVVLPLLAFGLWSGGRGSILGRLTALGALLALAYLYGFLAFGAALSVLTLAHIGILGLAFWALVLGFLALDPARVEEAFGDHVPRRATAAFLLAMAGLSTLQWGATIIGAAWSGTVPEDLARYGWSTNPLYAIELAFAVPLFAVAGILLVRRRPTGTLLAIPLLVLLTLLGLGLAWQPVFAALGGRSFDTGVAVAGLVFLSLPLALLAVTFGRQRQSTGVPPRA